jgi:hypothetical protein
MVSHVCAWPKCGTIDPPPAGMIRACGAMVGIDPIPQWRRNGHPWELSIGPQRVPPSSAFSQGASDDTTFEP